MSVSVSVCACVCLCLCVCGGEEVSGCPTKKGFVCVRVCLSERKSACVTERVSCCECVHVRVYVIMLSYFDRFCMFVCVCVCL